MQPGPGIECIDLTKKYRGAPALQDATVSFGTGVTALLGANGAGKTTLMSMVATLVRPTSGLIKVGGVEVKGQRGVAHARASIGYLPQSFQVLNGATVADNVAYAAWVHGVDSAQVGEQVDQVLEEVGLAQRRDVKARALSGGQRQRLGIACAVAHRPPVVLLDEPTVGVDPVQRVGIRQLVTALGQNATVLLSTHLIDDVSELAARTVVLREGLVVFDGTTQDLASQAQGDAQRGDRSRALESALMELMV